MYSVRNFVRKSQLNNLRRSVVPTTSVCSSRQQVCRREMCGLVAAIDDVWTNKSSLASSKHGIPLLDDREALRQTTRILDHRGPDGYEISTGTFGGDADVGNC